jgi:nicotinate-nucleotide pyrophosphorylase (carboxylating)
MNGSRLQFGEAEARNADTLIALALAEDLAQVGDITCTATIPSQARGTARFVARAPGGRRSSGRALPARLPVEAPSG